MTGKLLVTGASGQLGRRVVDHLLTTFGMPADRIVAATRDPSSLADMAAKNVDVRMADFDDAASLDKAFAGVERLLLVSTDAVGVPGKRLAQHRTAVAAAEKAGVKHVVYTSMPNPEPGSPIPFAPDHYGTEQALAASNMDWTILRNCWYMDNLERSLPQVLASGGWYTSAGTGRIGYVAREDCARAAAAALASDAAGRTTYDITGPAAVTIEEIAAIASEAFGKPIRVVQVSDEQLAQGLARAGLPEPMVELIVGFDANTRAGNVDIASNAVETLTGRKPMDFRTFFNENKAQFAA